MSTPVPVWGLVAPALLLLLYAMLIYFAFADLPGFYAAMEMPQPNHGFMHISWTGKTIAIWLVLAIATGSRRRSMLLHA